MITHKTAMGYSASTYNHALCAFDQYCCIHFPNETILTKELVEDWVRLIDKETINSLNRRLATIREFGRYLQSVGLPAYVMPPKMTASQTRYTPHIYTNQELTAFFHGADHFEEMVSDPLAQYIVPVIFRVIYCCGLRPAEGRMIKTEDVELSTGKIYIRETKRHKDRAVVLSDDVLSLCIAYNLLRENICGETEYFFPDKHGQVRGERWIAYQFRKCWRISGITEFASPSPRIYDFRHTFATKKLHDWMDSGENFYTMLPYLSAYMGHSTFSSTAYYIHLLPDRLKKSPAIHWQSFADLLPEVLP
ncbi:MAG: tyrosine-type recombinase/integrase [Tannerella sp.]|jgi:integrase|nr:tyrosine-type recombinase/integrase [Tannerella sp.]